MAHRGCSLEFVDWPLEKLFCDFFWDLNVVKLNMENKIDQKQDDQCRKGAALCRDTMSVQVWLPTVINWRGEDDAIGGDSQVEGGIFASYWEKDQLLRVEGVWHCVIHLQRLDSRLFLAERCFYGSITLQRPHLDVSPSCCDRQPCRPRRADELDALHQLWLMIGIVSTVLISARLCFLPFASCRARSRPSDSSLCFTSGTPSSWAWSWRTHCPDRGPACRRLSRRCCWFYR